MAKQRLSSGLPLPVYIDETNAHQSIAARTFVNQTIAVAVNVNLAAATSIGTAVPFAKEVDVSVSLASAASSGIASAFGTGYSINLTAASVAGTAAQFFISGKKGMLLLLGCGT